jgi:hypothetical protein
MNLQLPQKAGSFLTSWETVSFSSLHLMLGSNTLCFCVHSADCPFLQTVREPGNISCTWWRRVQSFKLSVTGDELSLAFQVDYYWRWASRSTSEGDQETGACSPSDGCRSSSSSSELNTSFAAERCSNTDWPSAGHSYDVAWGHIRLCDPTGKVVYLTFAPAVRTDYESCCEIRRHCDMFRWQPLTASGQVDVTKWNTAL